MIRLSVLRPVAVTMLYFCVALLGISAWRNIPVESTPDVSFPRLTLSYSWRGASPETAEAFATAPLEAAVQQVKGIQRITSTTREHGASITVEFTRDTDMDFARMELSERIGSVEDQLPYGVSAVSVTPYLPQAVQQQASRPFLRYTFTAPLLVEALRLHLDEIVIPELLQIRGVANVEVTGGRARLLEIVTEPERISALGLTTGQISGAISGLEQILAAPGAARLGDREWIVTLRNRPVDTDELLRTVLPLPGRGGADAPPITLDDIAVVRDGFEEATGHYRINGSPAVRIVVHKARGVNTLTVAEEVKARMAALEPMHPPGSRVILESDESVNISREMNDLQLRALIAGVVIFLVLLAFLRSFRTTGIVFATIGFSILIALNVVYFGGLTLNVFTMMGLALGFGLIVDNSIVVLENIHRQWEAGGDPVDASVKGARDVILPILASTLTTLIVFLPFLYLQGEMRIFYLPLAAVVALTLGASILVAFTFIPSLTARTLKRAPGGGQVARVDRPLPIYLRFYSGILGHTLRHPWITIIVVAACFSASWYVFDNHVSRNSVFGGGGGAQQSTVSIRMTMPRGSDLSRLDDLTQFFEERLGGMPEISQYTSEITGSTSTIRAEFPEELNFTAVPLVIQERIGGFALGFTGVQISVTGDGPAFTAGATGSSLANYSLTLLGYNYERLGEIADNLGARLALNARVQSMNTNASTGTSARLSEVVATVDRDAADRHGVTVAEALNLLTSAVSGPGRQGAVILGGESVSFQVRLEGYRTTDVGRLLETVVATPSGLQIPLGEIFTITEREVVASIFRENQQYERTIAYEFRGPTLLGNVVRDSAVAATALPPGYSLRDRSPFRLSSEDQAQIRFVLLISLGLIFMVTAALYESVRQPFCILLTVPMALIGVFLIFFYANIAFTREAYLGVIMMGGIVVNNAILLVDHINRVRSETVLPLFDAIIQATLDRVRPILMTTATTVFGLLPLVLFTPTVNATIWNALTYALIGGLLSSTLFVLTTTPALYYLFERGRANTPASSSPVESGGAPAPAPR